MRHVSTFFDIQLSNSRFFPILRGITTLEEAMDRDNAKRNLIETVEQVFRLIVAIHS